jgi:hypothetical protein
VVTIVAQIVSYENELSGLRSIRSQSQMRAMIRLRGATLQGLDEPQASCDNYLLLITQRFDADIPSVDGGLSMTRARMGAVAQGIGF